MDYSRVMKGPTRPAPAVPVLQANKYFPVTDWDNDPFGDVFEPQPQFSQKKKPPPRPPPPKINSRQPEIPFQPSHFIRRPTVLTSLLSRKSRGVVSQNIDCNQGELITDFNNEIETHKIFPKCEAKTIQTGALIDLSSPPSSPTFTTRSSSDGLSVDSFGSDATTSTNHHNAHNGGNASQTESGFEDDFDLFSHSRKNPIKENTMEDLSFVDPFSSQSVIKKPPLMKKPIITKEVYSIPSVGGQSVGNLKGPTIIRAKPARPKPPDNSAILKTTFGCNFPVTTMNINTTTPIQKISNGCGDAYDIRTEDFLDSWDNDHTRSEREWSPPMPSIPPPPPPDSLDANSSLDLIDAESVLESTNEPVFDSDAPYAVAMFDYFTDHPDDLCFSVGARITLLRRIDSEWLYGRAGGAEGMFPRSYVQERGHLPLGYVATS